MPPANPNSGSLNPTPTESEILQSYLLTPSSLPTIIPLPTFTTLLPTQHRSHPHIRSLYRDLQFQRNVDVDAVRENIERESGQGERLRLGLERQVKAEMDGKDAEATRARKKRRTGEYAETTATKTEDDAETDVFLDTTLLLGSDPNNLGMVPSRAISTYHTLESLLSSMETACKELEKEADDAGGEADQILAEMRETVGALSDLRYGKFSRASGVEEGEREGEGKIEREVVKGLRGLVGVCD